MNLGFYNGRPGQDFSIKMAYEYTDANGEKKFGPFPNKVALDADLARGWTSPVMPGEYVVVSYGLPSDPDYNIKKQPDLDTYGNSYNSTLWIKRYDKNEAGSAKGLKYELISSMTGNTPAVEVITPITVLNADEKPDVIGDNSDPDFFKLTFKLPQAQVVESENVKTVWAPSGSEVAVAWDTETEGNVNRPVVTFTLPKAQLLQLMETVVANADDFPSVDLNDDDPSLPKLTFTLPQAQVMGDPTTAIIGPDENPDVEIDNTNINAPVLKFQLPRAVHFYYGNLLGNSADGQYVLTLADYVDNPEYSTLTTLAIGDYYINSATGFVYCVSAIAEDASAITFDYVACLQAPDPETATEWISPFDAEGNRVGGQVSSSYTDEAEKKGWKLTYQLPLNPNFEVAPTNFVGSAQKELNNVELNVTDTDTMTFTFTLAQGSRVYAGFGAPTLTEALPGDLYIDSESGKVYERTETEWVAKEGTIKGPVGDTLKVTHQLTYTSADAEDTLNAISALIEAAYGVPASDEIIAVTYRDETGDEIAETAYWYYYARENSTATSGVWGRALLTGSVTSLIENEYLPNGDTAKTYSVSYVNALIDDTDAETDPNAAIKTFSKAQVSDMLSWGSFSDLIP